VAVALRADGTPKPFAGQAKDILQLSSIEHLTKLTTQLGGATVPDSSNY